MKIRFADQDPQILGEIEASDEAARLAQRPRIGKILSLSDVLRETARLQENQSRMVRTFEEF